MPRKESLMRNINPGMLYRRADLCAFSTSVDRHLAQLVREGKLQKVSAGLYLNPQVTKWGMRPAEDKALVRGFLKDDRFLMFSYSSYNSLGLGTTQLYNHTVVYNCKRHGQFKLGGRTFDFRRRPDFPTKFDRETLLVDMLNNLSDLAENQEMVLTTLEKKLSNFDKSKLEVAAKLYGKVGTKKYLGKLLHGKKIPSSR
ncbi:MAG: hypothetical protein A2X86_11010 [Bdellovibrionales bacterium GWA2_49_15]|nr:MAG: hypothetical protein A2X86_11010 [Bdellovibrionales bacterium GWA2_49_15]HAZ11506.1 hypothetical protein [Bdellovibrionales bacterium]